MMTVRSVFKTENGQKEEMALSTSKGQSEIQMSVKVNPCNY